MIHAQVRSITGLEKVTKTTDDSGSSLLLKRLAQGELLVSDGATATYLQAHGLEPGGCPEEFNVSHPDIVRGLARAYFDAGSDMVLTNSFGANKYMLTKYGHGNRVREFNRLAAEHARSQAPQGHFVVGSVGPTGEFLQPLGEVSKADMLSSFAEQIVALEEGGADAVVIETKTALDEASLAIRAAKENTNLAIFATMVFDKGPRGFFTMMGVTPDQGMNGMLEAGADVVGANCGNGIDGMVELYSELRKATDGYVLIHSNAGIPTIVDGEIVYPETPDYMAKRFKVLVDEGINIVGGCCGTGPDHIRSLVETVRE